MAPIHDVAADGDLADLNRLLENTERIDASDGSGMTPLMYAACEEQDAVAVRLLDLGADVGLADNDRYMAAHFACIRNMVSVLALLIAAGTPLNVRDKWGATLLIKAALHNATEYLTLLLARGADAIELNSRDEDGRTALSHAAAFSGRAENVQLLLQAGADPHHPR